MTRTAGFERLSIDELVALYLEAAVRHGAAKLGHDASVGNADADRIAQVYRELRRRGEQSVLLALLDNPDSSVRGWAATHAMEFAPSEGEPVLMELARSPDVGLIGFSAEITLTEWREGRLRFP